MDQLDQSIESVPSSSALNHDGELYGVAPAHIDPFSMDHVYPLSSMMSYDQGGLPFWNPYLTSILASDTLGLSFDLSMMNMSADSTAIADCAAGNDGRQLSWSTSMGSYELQAEQDFDPAINPVSIRPNCTDIDPRSIMQQPEEQLRQDEPHPVPDAPPSPLSRNSHPEQQPQQPSRPDKKQIRQPAAGLKIKTSKKTIGGIKRGQPQDGNDDQPERRDSKRRGRPPKTQHASTKPVLSPVDTFTASTSRPLNQSPSSGSLAEGGTPSSPGLYKATSFLSIGDGSMASIRDSLDRHGRTLLSKPDNNDDDARSAESDVSPVLRGMSQYGPFSRIPSSQEPIVTSTAFSTHQSYHSHGQPGRSSISSTTSSSTGSQQEGGTQSSPTTSISSSSLTAEPAKTTAQSHRDAPASKQRWRAPESDQKARNRVAATKCRLKTKAAIARLEVEERVASERNRALGGTLAGLREEALGLRSQLLMHSDCGCTLIQQYLANRARRLAASGAEGERGDAGGEGVSKGRDGREVDGHMRDEEAGTDSEFVEEGHDGLTADEGDEEFRGHGGGEERTLIERR